MEQRCCGSNPHSDFQHRVLFKKDFLILIDVEVTGSQGRKNKGLVDWPGTAVLSVGTLTDCGEIFRFWKLLDSAD
jgi:hypothetical protein